MTDLSGRVAFVTGGSGQIGGAVAEALAAEGAAVAVGYHGRREAAEAVARTFDRAMAVGVDVADAASVDRAFGEIEAAFGDVGILVNCAGARRDGLVLRMAEDDWDDVMAVNLRSAFLCTRRALLGMVKARWGRIISVGSPAGSTGSPGQANYAAAKAGLVAFSTSVAREVGRKGVTANVVVPGFVESAMTADLDAAARDRVLDLSASGAPVDAADVARAVVFLAASPGATAATLRVDGGMP